MKENTKIFVAGHNGMLGSAITRLLFKRKYNDVITVNRDTLNLINNNEVKVFFEKEKPEIVIIAAAKVGGIQANIDSPVEFLYDNLMIQNNLIYESYKSGVKKIVFLGSSCIYPKDCSQPMKEEYINTGRLEPTNEGYALAKLAGIKLVQSIYKQYGCSGINIIPCNLYGTNDNFDPLKSHVLSSLVRKFIEATADDEKKLILWGTGIAKREFMHVDDAAEATLYFLENYNSPDIINIGWGTDISIKELAEKIAALSGYKGSIEWDSSKPNGMLQKCMDVTKMKTFGFTPKITLEEGIEKTIHEYKEFRIKQISTI